MTTTDIEQRNSKSDKLKVFQFQDGQYYVESSEGKICYRVSGSNGTKSCSCGDYTTRIAKDPNFQCKHILAVINGNGNIRNIQIDQHPSPKLDERFIIQIKRKETVKEFVLYAGLLDLAHQKGIKRMIVEPIQYPTKDNKMEAICKAIVESTTGEIYVELADANPLNVNRMVVEHMLRVAATRAKARALRDFTNIGMTCLEELGDLGDELDDDSGRARTRSRRDARTETTNQAPPRQEQIKGGAPTDDPRNKETQQAKKEAVKVSEAAGKTPNPGAKPAGTPDKKAQNNKGAKDQVKPSEAQIKAIEKLAERRGINGQQLVKIFMDKFQKPYVEINADEAKNFIKHLQQAA